MCGEGDSHRKRGNGDGIKAQGRHQCFGFRRQEEERAEGRGHEAPGKACEVPVRGFHPGVPFSAGADSGIG